MCQLRDVYLYDDPDDALAGHDEDGNGALLCRHPHSVPAIHCGYIGEIFSFESNSRNTRP